MIIVILVSGCAAESVRGEAPVRPTPLAVTVRSGPMHLTPAPELERAREKYVAVAVADDFDECRLELPDAIQAPKFACGESSISITDDAALRVIARCVTSGPLAGRTLLLIGRADARGPSERNRALGLERAQGLRARLEALGVDRDHIQVTSRGELDADGTDEAGWRLDRRVDILLAD